MRWRSQSQIDDGVILITGVVRSLLILIPVLQVDLVLGLDVGLGLVIMVVKQ